MQSKGNNPFPESKLKANIPIFLSELLPVLCYDRDVVADI